MKKFFSSIGAKVLGLFAVGTVGANAAVDVTGVALDTSPVETLAVTILGALAIIWVARKVIGFLGR